MRTWLQPVQFASGPAGKPRRVHLRRVELSENGTMPDGRQKWAVASVSPRALCNAGGIVPAVNVQATCRQCLRLKEKEKAT